MHFFRPRQITNEYELHTMGARVQVFYVIDFKTDHWYCRWTSGGAGPMFNVWTYDDLAQRMAFSKDVALLWTEQGKAISMTLNIYFM